MSTVVDAPFDEYLDTPNKSPRQNVARQGVVLHHAAMTSLSGLQSLAMGGKQVSATAIVKDRISKRLMADGFRAWSLSSAWGDSAFRSVETCNESADGWTISEESHAELAWLVAFWAVLDGFWPHRDGDPRTWTVVGHREMYTIHGVSYGTACPGGMDLDLVTKWAQGILTGEGLDDMPTVADIFNTKVAKGPDGNDITLAEFIAYAHVWNARETWRHPLTHTVVKGANGKPIQVPAGDFLRSEPAEHAGTRAAILKVATGDFDYEAVAAEIAAQFPDLDPHAIAVAAADEADRRARERLTK